MLAGYAFRSAGDGRAHGAAASLGLDIPLAGAFALRPEGLVLAFGESRAAPSSLSLLGGALSLVYRFDDTDARALVAVGPLGGASVDGGAVELVAGAQASLGLRFPVLPAVDVEARVALPLVLWTPRGGATPGSPTLGDGSSHPWPLQTSFSLGISVDAGALLSGDASADP